MKETLASQWVARWDAQQEYYMADREERFAVIADVVAHVTAGQPEPVVLDLACGPGSLSARIARRLPGARITAVDTDPFLLSLAGATYPDVATFVDANLSTVDLAALVGTADVAVSTTALHWLPDEHLGALYRQLAGVLRPGGVFVNGDHLPDEQPALAKIAVTVRQERAERVGVSGNEQWAAWWAAAAEVPEFGPLLAERATRFPPGSHDHELTVQRHTELLRQAGFTEVGTVWQVGDDKVLVAVK
jgi:trans-aconitate methyltransferase